MFHESQFLAETFLFLYMDRKKWTPKTEITGNLLKFREKRKWQLALRRYVLEKSNSATYAFYFGLGINDFRRWIEIQFTEDLKWENFGSAWQFEHLVPVGYFDFAEEEDLRLCWNFINIRVEKIEMNESRKAGVDLIAVQPYFEALYNKTGYSLCLKMKEKIDKILATKIVSEPAIESFIIENKGRLEIIKSLNKEEFTGLNSGISLEDILLEREIIKKFG